jgi:hypothetical protein
VCVCVCVTSLSPQHTGSTGAPTALPASTHTGTESRQPLAAGTQDNERDLRESQGRGDRHKGGSPLNAFVVVPPFCTGLRLLVEGLFSSVADGVQSKFLENLKTVSEFMP